MFKERCLHTKQGFASSRGADFLSDATDGVIKCIECGITTFHVSVRWEHMKDRYPHIIPNPAPPRDEYIIKEKQNAPRP